MRPRQKFKTVNIVSKNSAGTTVIPFTFLEENVAVDSVVGDFKSPNPHRYAIFRDTNILGYERKLGYRIEDGLDVSSTTEGIPPYYGGMFDDLGSPDSFEGALSSLYEKISGSLNLSIDLAEHAQTRKMIGSSIKAVDHTREFVFRTRRDFFGITQRSLKRSNHIGLKAIYLASKSSKLLADKWLEYQYGWRPLAQSAAESAAKLVNHHVPNRLFVVARHKDTIERNEITLVDPFCHAYLFNSHRTMFHVYYRSPNGYEDFWNSFSLNPLAIAWELIPFSFVFDWFYDLGGYMSNFEKALKFNTQFKSGFFTTTEKTVETYEWNALKDISNGVYSIQWDYSAKRRRESLNLDRVLLFAPPLPRAPRFHAKLGSGRLLNAAALLRQLL